MWQVAKLKEVANSNLPLANKVLPGPEHGTKRVLHHPHSLVGLDLQGAATGLWPQGEDDWLGPVHHLVVEEAERGNIPVPCGVHGTEDNFLENQ